MAETIIRDRRGSILGYIEDGATEQVGRDRRRGIVGYYSQRDNITRDRRRSIVGTGNLLVSLITEAG